jgi:hypothetical protein
VGKALAQRLSYQSRTPMKNCGSPTALNTGRMTVTPSSAPDKAHRLNSDQSPMTPGDFSCRAPMRCQCTRFLAVWCSGGGQRGGHGRDILYPLVTNARLARGVIYMNVFFLYKQSVHMTKFIQLWYMFEIVHHQKYKCAPF